MREPQPQTDATTEKRELDRAVEIQLLSWSASIAELTVRAMRIEDERRKLDEVLHQIKGRAIFEIMKQEGCGTNAAEVRFEEIMTGAFSR